MNTKDHTLFVLAGPTASGKTAHAVSLARHFGTQIISADSRQFYKELKIGVAIPSEQEQQLIPHHFIGNISIFDYYNASRYEVEVLSLLDKLFSEHPVIILTGGSGLYIDTVCNGIDDLPVIDQALREQLIGRHAREGLEILRRELFQLDPEFCTTADLKNPKRVLKALEVSMQTGRPYSSFLTRQTRERPFRIIKTGLMPERETLYTRINQRVDEMLSSGLVEEARNLLPHKGINALNTVGYKELFAYFEGQISLDEAIRLIKRNTRHYAKRQITWFARDPSYIWFKPGECDEMIRFFESKLLE
jgi:tRNA dimethylallyltransferase